MIADQQGLPWPQDMPRYKGNLHSHTTNSDGRLTPAEAVAAFRAQGYQFLCLSEHDLFTDYSDEFDDEGFIILPGIEASAYLFADESRATRLRCHHMQGILGTDEMVATAPKRFAHMERLEPPTYVGTWDGLAVARKVAAELAAHGCAVTYNHPIWSRIEPEDLMASDDALDCVFGIEVWNYDTVNECALGADTVYWDMLLRRGVRVGAIAADDNHNPGTFDDAFGGWVVVCAPELARDAVVRALLDGRYYSSAGPEVRGFGVADGHAWIECSPCERVNLICGGPIGVGETRIAPAGERLERVEFTLRGTETYLRFECIDANGRTAWTNALR